MPDLIIDHLSKSYGRTRALDDISCCIQPGLFGLLGPNGAGKTTLIRIIATLLSPSCGSLRYDTHSWKQPESVRPLIGYLPQKFSLYKTIRVEEALTHIGRLKGIPSKSLAGQVAQAMDRVNLTEWRHKKIQELSGGMVRRVGIAQSLLGNPPIIVIDEPTAGLDPEERIRFRQVLRSLEQDSIVIISTHIVEDIDSICTHTAMLDRGHLVFCGTIADARLLADGKVFTARVAEEEYTRLLQTETVVFSERQEGGYAVRLVTETPPPGATPVSPTLEDSYMATVGHRNEKAG